MSFDQIGVNLCIGSFAGDILPGQLWTNYGYPNNQELDWCKAKGFNIVRIDFLGPRIINSATNITFRNTDDITIIDGLVSHANSLGIKVILDLHDYGYWFGTLINNQTTYNQLAEFWKLMANRYKNSPNVLYGLMNEPNRQTGQEWLGAINPSIAAIRSTGATQPILVQGTHYTSALHWVDSGSAAAINPNTIVDPLNNYWIEMHQYLDDDGSGRGCGISTNPPGPPPARLVEATNWAKGFNPKPKLFLGEFGVCEDAASLEALRVMSQYMHDNGDVWHGAAYFAAGPWWGDYYFTLEPEGLGTGNVVDQPQIAVITPFIVPGGGEDTKTGTVTVTDAEGGSATANFDVTVTAEAPPPNSQVTVQSAVVEPAAAPQGTERTLTVKATSSTNSKLTFGEPQLAGATFRAVPGQPAGTAKWNFTF